jgi:carboxyl-terminal processing protease
MRHKVLNIILICFSILALLGSGFFLGFNLGKKTSKIINVRGIANIDNKTSADFGIFWETWSAIHQNYLRDSEVPEKERVYGAVQGLVRSLGDPYSEFFKPEDAKKFEEDISGSFGGIGAEIGSRDGFIVIVSPLKNSPAERAGLKPGDKILMINSTSTEGMSVVEAVKLIRGEVGTEVKLTILREKEEKPKEIKIIREIIQVPTLDYEVKDGILIVKLYSFNTNAEELFYKAVVDGFLRQKAQGLVLDLRNNPGGFLDVAVDLAGWFLKKGTLVVKEVTREKNNGGNNHLANGNGALKDIPVVVLVNKGSASASEILAGALQIQRGVKLVGEETFGKGTVQRLIKLSDGSSLKITVANWVLPNGQILEGNGLKPDIEVKTNNEEQDNKDTKNDPQLQKALEVVKEEIKNKNK